MSFVKVTKEFLQMVAGELDPYTTEKSQIKVNNYLSLSIFTPAHVQFAKYGRGPGKRPPMDAIEQWVKYEGIIIGNLSQKGTAYVIAKSIGDKGTKNWVPNAPDAVTEAINKHLFEYIQNTNNKHLDDTVKKLNEQLKRQVDGGKAPNEIVIDL